MGKVHCWTLAGSLVLVAIAPALAPAADAVVRLTSGREFAGMIDGRGDAERFWLRTAHGGVTIRRPIAWDHIVWGSVDGRELSPDDFRAAALAAAGEDATADAASIPSPAIGDETPAIPPPAAEAIPPCRLALPLAAAYRAPRVRSLSIDAFVANWDDDVEADGLVLHVYPLANGWRLVPVTGTLTVELFGERLQASARREAFPQVGRWTEAVHPTDFGPAGAVYQLEFRHAHPEFDLDLAAHGLLRVQLTAPGHGTFEASLAELRVRPYSGVRDRIQQHRGRRFLPAERTSR